MFTTCRQLVEFRIVDPRVPLAFRSILAFFEKLLLVCYQYTTRVRMLTCHLPATFVTLKHLQ